MDAQRWAVIDTLYHAALAKEPGERASYLAAACADDPTPRSEIESLLAYADAQLSSPVQGSELAKLQDRVARIPFMRSSDGAEPVGVANVNGNVWSGNTARKIDSCIIQQ